MSSQCKIKGDFAATSFSTESGEGAVVIADGSVVAVLLPDPAKELSERIGEFGARQYVTDLGLQCADLLQRYWKGERVEFAVPLCFPEGEGFRRRVMEEVARIPYGEISTYGEIARRVGSPRAARAVGSVMARNPIPIIIPCHRVVGGTGALVGYTAPGGTDLKAKLLALEGHLLDGRGRVKGRDNGR